MATLVLSAGASALISGFALSGPAAAIISGAATVAGALVDNFLVSSLTPGTSQSVEGARLDSLEVMSSSEGGAIPFVAGWARLSGQVIWATNLREVVTTTTEKHGGKGGGPKSSVTTTTYSYFASFAVGICEGPISKILRVWADGKEMDLTRVTMRTYMGTEHQEPDPLIMAKQGTSEVPAYRGLAYVVFDELPLANYGNRLPQITFEVVRSVGYEEDLVQGVAVIPGSTEFGYSTTPIKDKVGPDTTDNNRHTLAAATDWEHSLNLLQGAAPSVNSAALVVAWFGDDLRADHCTIAPRIEAQKETTPDSWRVAGLARGQAQLVSYVDGKPAYGGAPTDKSVIEAIQDLKARGFEVLLYPFIMMDVPPGNGLDDPYGRDGQPEYPWRGRITCNPAPGQAGTPDKTSAAASQVAAFLGSAKASDFGGSGNAVTYSGPAEWSYRRFILHLAKLADLAGGVDAFCIGTEMPGLTSVRGTGNTFPFVDGLIDLAGEVRATLGSSTKIGYAADWSEYHSYRPNDGSGDVFFHLDPLWSNENIDFIGIDNYLPLSDWRDETGHVDHTAGAQSIYDLSYLKGGIEGGEYFDFYYATGEDRAAQIRTPIIDSAHGEDWVFRQKDLRGWWSNPHHNRPGGVRDSVPTGWLTESKPIWFTEFGCPAIDKGTNQPNVFFDPKSSESAYPHFSSGVRDDFIQRRYLRAHCEYWQDASNNPVSDIYGGPMVEPSKMFAWAWDVRPFPSYPVEADIWADSGNFPTGHWLSGRLGGAPADGVARAMLDRSGLIAGVDYDTSGCTGVSDGFIIDNVTTARSVIETLSAAYFFDTVESNGRIEARSRHSRYPVAQLGIEDLAERKSKEPISIKRAQATELPKVVRVTGIDSYKSFQTVTAEAILEASTSDRVTVTSVPIVADYVRLQAMAETLLQEAWASRESFSFELPFTALELEPGDLVSLEHEGRLYPVRIISIRDADTRKVEARRYDAPVYEAMRGQARVFRRGGMKRSADVVPVLIDGPLLRDTDNDWQGYFTAYQLPFAPGISLFSSPENAGFSLRGILEQAGVIGELIEDLQGGPLYRWDNGNSVVVKLYSGELSSISEALVYAGGNALLVQNAGGDWELLQFANAELIGEKTYRLTKLLRGQRGSEVAMGAAAGARVVALSGGIIQTGLDRAQVGLPLNWQAGRTGDVLGGASFVSFQASLSSRAARPLSPVHLKAVRTGGDDVALSWVRRTRVGGDSWEVFEVPLGEDTEAYEVEVWTGGNLVRTLATPFESAVYTATQQLEDFGGPAGSFEFYVFQISSSFGRGLSAAGVFEG